MAANARPVAGQIGVALGWIEAIVRPTFARTKYAQPIITTSAAYFAKVLASQPGRDLAALRGSNVTPLLIAGTTGAFLTGGYDAIMACLTRH